LSSSGNAVLDEGIIEGDLSEALAERLARVARNLIHVGYLLDAR
jgi:hypothetical protein